MLSLWSWEVLEQVSVELGLPGKPGWEVLGSGGSAQNGARSPRFHLLASLCSSPLPAEPEQKEQPTGQKPTLKNDEL